MIMWYRSKMSISRKDIMITTIGNKTDNDKSNESNDTEIKVTKQNGNFSKTIKFQNFFKTKTYASHALDRYC